MLCCRKARSRVYSRFNGRWKRCRNLTRRNKAICRSFAVSHPPRRLRHKARDCCAKTPQQSLRALCGVFECWQHKYGIIKPKAAHPVKEEENEQSRSKRKLPHCFLCGSFCFFSAAPLRSVPPYSAPAKGRFCPPYLWPQCCPAFPGMAACFAERSYYTREKSIGTPLRAFILLFPPVFTMFFIKKSLQMNFKNLLYDYKFNFFTQTFSFRFVWGSEVCAFRAASALR